MNFSIYCHLLCGKSTSPKTLGNSFSLLPHTQKLHLFLIYFIVFPICYSLFLSYFFLQPDLIFTFLMCIMITICSILDQCVLVCVLLTQLCPMFLCVCVSHSAMSDSLQLHGLQPGCPWNSPSKNTGVGCHALLQGIRTQVSHIAGGLFIS